MAKQHLELIDLTIGLRMRCLASANAFFCAVFLSTAAYSKTLEVGPNHALKQPSAAAALARDGDIVEIEPGGYVDCAVWTANRLLIVGKASGAVVTTKSCEGKGLFVVRGNDVTIRNLTFARARVRDANGAGIRVEGRNLTVQRSRFVENENGILAGSMPGSTIRILDSEFVGNGSCEKECAHGIYINQVALLHVEHSTFRETRVGHHIKSRALSTRLIGNDIRDGESGASSYLVDIPNGGSLIMENNVLEKGPLTNNRTVAIMIGAEGVTHRTAELRLTGNKFVNRLPHDTMFVRNLTDVQATLVGNKVTGKATPLLGRGTVE